MIFHACYPYPDSIDDSNEFIVSALSNNINPFRPIGYSWFLMIIHSFSESISLIFKTQILLYGIGILFFIQTVSYFFPEQPTWIRLIMTGGLVLSPTAIYMSNTFMPDILLTSLTLIWLGTLAWIIFRKNVWMLLLNFALLILIIQTSYIGLFFPFISFLAVVTTYGRSGVLAGIVPFLILIHLNMDTRKKMEKQFQVSTYSPTTNWQLANNVVSMVPYVKPDSAALRIPSYWKIHNYMKSYGTTFFPRKEATPDFMFSQELPLRQYFNHFRAGKNEDFRKTWAKAGTDLGNYAKSLIKLYPVEYFKYFVLGNCKRVIYPTPVITSQFNEIKPDRLTRRWFGLPKDTRFIAKRPFYSEHVAPILPVANLLIWISFLGAIIIGGYKLRHQNWKSPQYRFIQALLTFLIVFLGFGIFATPLELRHMLPIFAVRWVSPLLILGLIFQLQRKELKSTIPEIEQPAEVSYQRKSYL